jgi:hypothetical protein
MVSWNNRSTISTATSPTNTKNIPQSRIILLQIRSTNRKIIKMGEVASPVFTMQEATIDDVRDMATIFLRGLSWDPLSKAFDEVMPFEDQVEIQIQRQVGRLTVGHELGACRTWKVVDEHG